MYTAAVPSISHQRQAKSCLNQKSNTNGLREERYVRAATSHSVIASQFGNKQRKRKKKQQQKQQQ